MSETEIDLSGNLNIAEPINQAQGKGKMALSLSNISMREYFNKTREGIQPWGEFINTSKFKAPKSIAPVGKRVIKNVEKFQSNYFFVIMGLMMFCILTSPLLLVAIAACLLACYLINKKNNEQKLKIMGRELSLAQQYAAVGVLAFPLFWIAGAGSAVFWIIGASFFIVMLHASMYITEDELELAELEAETV